VKYIGILVIQLLLLIKNHKHLYKQNGTFHVCLTVFNHEGCDSSYCQDIYVENPTIGDQRNLRNISVFPNPGKGHFTVLNSSGSDDYKFMLLNALGEIVQEGRVSGMKVLSPEH
jgi:hypothetical protein